MTYYTRQQWGAVPATGTGNPVTNGPAGVAIHYDGGAPVPVGTTCKCDAIVRGIQSRHMAAGNKDILYDLVACQHGNLYQARYKTALGTGANGTGPANRDYMAVMALIGGDQKPTDDLLRAILTGIEMCRSIGAGKIVTGHGTFVNTPCPGTHLWKWVTSGTPSPGVKEEEEVTELTTELRLGANSEQVKLLQTMLNGLIGANLDADGSFGSATERAVKSFQTEHGLDADGIVGPATRTQLNKDWALYLVEPPVVDDPAVEEPVIEPTDPDVIDAKFRALVLEIVNVDDIAQKAAAQVDLDLIVETVVAALIERLTE